jgi:hypothetical protein
MYNEKRRSRLNKSNTNNKFYSFFFLFLSIFIGSCITSIIYCDSGGSYIIDANNVLVYLADKSEYESWVIGAAMLD